MAVTESREFTIALCGFSESDQKVLHRAFLLSRVQPKRYIFWTPSRQRPDLCMINEDLTAGLDAWLDLRKRFPAASLPMMRVGMAARDPDPLAHVAHVFFKRPILANRILKALDALVSDAYGFSPELSIHDEMLPQPASATEPAIPVPSGVATSSKRILVVDDSESVRKIMELRLLKMGYAVDFAETGEAALTRAKTTAYDLIFLDVMLPGINGYDVSRQLKRHLHLQVPVVMLTGKTSRMDKLRGTLALADAYLTKPLTIENLNKTLQRFLS